jgi:hypothetical protein
MMISPYYFGPPVQIDPVYVFIKMVKAPGYFQENANIAMLLREVDQI